MKLRNLIFQSILWRGFYFASVLLLNIMIARYYEASYSGLLFFVTNSFALFVTISSLSMESGVAYYASSGQIALSRLANFSFWWALTASIIIYIILKTGIYFGIFNKLYETYLFYAVCYIMGCMLVNFFAATFYSQKNFLTPNIALGLVNCILIIILPLTSGKIFSVEVYMHVYFIGFLAQGFLIAFLFYSKYGWFNLFNFPTKQEFVKIFKYGAMSFLGNLLFFLVYRIDYWFVEAYCSTASLGNYIQVSKLVQTLFILPSIIASAVFPAIISSEERRISEKIAIIARVLLLVYIIVCTSLAVTGFWLFPFIFGNTFSQMYISFLLLMPGILALVMVYPVTAYFAGIKRLKVNVMSLFLTFLVIIAGNIIITPRYGINGAAAVSSIGYIFYHTFLLFFFRKENSISYLRIYKISIKDFYKLKQMITDNRKTHL